FLRPRCLRGALDEVPLAGPYSVERPAPLGFLYRPRAAKPIGRRSEAIAIIIDQRMLGRQSPFIAIEFRRLMRSAKESLKNRGLPITIEIGLRIRNSVREIAAKACIILLVTASRRHN